MTRWQPTARQIVAIDSWTARVPLGVAATMIGVSPRTLRSFQLRLGRVRDLAEPVQRDMVHNVPADAGKQSWHVKAETARLRHEMYRGQGARLAKRIEERRA